MEAMPLICITGTTGSGKNDLGLRVAEALCGEIVSLDSMKVYRGMDIGTAKPRAADLLRVRHHLIDILDPHERMDLRRFLSLADQALLDLRRRGVPALAVGGTAMYLTGLLFGVSEGPSRNEEFRRNLRAERDQVGVAALHARLQELDPESGARIDPHDFQRIERALEVVQLTGSKASALRAAWFQAPRYDAGVYVVTWPREILRERIDRRVDEMFDAGWVDEVRRIQEAGGFSPEASQALGYAAILELIAGRGTEAEWRRQIKTKTWQFARRQLTWMRKYGDATMLLREKGDDMDRLASTILDAEQRRRSRCR